MDAIKQRINRLYQRIESIPNTRYTIKYNDGSQKTMRLMELLNCMEQWGDILEVVCPPESKNNLMNMLIQGWDGFCESLEDLA